VNAMTIPRDGLARFLHQMVVWAEAGYVRS
jgi:hypothetical protein